MVFPSLLDGQSSMEKDDGGASVFGQIYKTLQSQNKSHVRYDSFHLAPSSKKIDDPMIFAETSLLPTFDHDLAESTTPSCHYRSGSNLILDYDEEQEEVVPQNYALIFDDNEKLPTVSPKLTPQSKSEVSVDAYDVSQDDDFEPLPWSPEHDALWQDETLLSHFATLGAMEVV